MRLSTGEKLGPYEITGLIGKGGMGEVYGPSGPDQHGVEFPQAGLAKELVEPKAHHWNGDCIFKGKEAVNP